MRGLLGSWRYVLTNALLVAFIAALAHGGWPIWAVAGLSILIGGRIDEAVGDDHPRAGSISRLFCDANLYATLPLLMIVTYLLLRLMAPVESTGLLAQVGRTPVITAVIGVGYLYVLAGATVAHELAHRVTNPLALIWARALLALSINPTFETYHVLGHHRNVGTYRDPATARRGEYVLAFVIRTVIEQSIAGWRLESERLRRKGLPVWSWHNRVLGVMLCSIAILAFAAAIGGFAGLVALFAAAVFGRIFHEMINYVQHYGVVRAEGTPVAARHAWDCCHLLSNALHYNLPHHADHHMFALKPFWELEAAVDSPKLPHGYQTMAMIALFPSWWHGVTDPLLADWDARLANDAERSMVRERGWAMDVLTRKPMTNGSSTLDRNAGA